MTTETIETEVPEERQVGSIPDEDMQSKEELNQISIERLSEDSRETIHQLRKWLIDHGNSEDCAVFTTESIRVFYWRYILPTIRPPAEVAITVKRADCSGQHIWLHTVWPTKINLDSPEQSTQINDLIEDFTRNAAIPLLPNPSLHIDFFSRGNPSAAPLEEIIQKICQAESSEYIGPFRTEVSYVTPSSSST